MTAQNRWEVDSKGILVGIFHPDKRLIDQTIPNSPTYLKVLNGFRSIFHISSQDTKIIPRFFSLFN
jgi:hypothetical protein